MPTKIIMRDVGDFIIGWHGAPVAIRARLLEAFCANIRRSTLVSNTVTLLVLVGLLVPHLDDPLHIGWLIVVVLGGLLPRNYAAALRRNGNYNQSPERKALTFIAISGAYGLAWGAGPLLLLPALNGPAVGILLFVVTFGTIMGPYAVMPGVLYVRLLTTGVPTLVAVSLYTDPQIVIAGLTIGLWLVLRTDIWRSYHRALRQQLELQEALEARKTDLERANSEKEEANNVLKHLADTDPLTGVANRRQFKHRLNEVSGPAAIILLDIDYFKKINDTYGHPVGDAALVEIARRVQDILRREDLLARIGGEEFAIILADGSEQGAWVIAERVRESLGMNPVKVRGQDIPVTASLGIAIVPPGHPADGAILRDADAALYKAKQNGRNRTVLAAGPQLAQADG
jgi:diguanylate cyclase (GGDEF)-like protein